ncbi:Fumarate hydratase [Bertholletia excelsa]
MVESSRFSACWRSLSTSFGEERETFGPILVPSDNSMLIYLSQNHSFCCGCGRVVKYKPVKLVYSFNSCCFQAKYDHYKLMHIHDCTISQYHLLK